VTIEGEILEVGISPEALILVAASVSKQEIALFKNKLYIGS
jgi:hypothetical protein